MLSLECCATKAVENGLKLRYKLQFVEFVITEIQKLKEPKINIEAEINIVALDCFIKDHPSYNST